MLYVPPRGYSSPLERHARDAKGCRGTATVAETAGCRVFPVRRTLQPASRFQYANDHFPYAVDLTRRLRLKQGYLVKALRPSALVADKATLKGAL